MIKVSKKVLNDYKRIIESTIILLEDNPKIEDISGFYTSESQIYELNNLLNDINEVLK